MKFVRLVLVSALCYVSFTITAQTKQQSAITDDDLRKYAITLDSVQVMQQTLNQIISENVQKNTVMKVARYNELFKIEKDQAKLTAANATPEEIEFLKEISALREYNVQRINAAYQSLAKDYVGLKAFNAIKKSIETDPQLKARYETISTDVKAGTKSPSDSQGR